MQQAARRRGSRRDEQGPTGSRGPSRDAGTQNREFPLFNLSRSEERDTGESPDAASVRPCVPVSAVMGCARSPLQSGRPSWTVLCRSPERLHARLLCLLLRLSSKDRAVPPSLLALLTALPFVVRGDITHQVVDALFVAANTKRWRWRWRWRRRRGARRRQPLAAAGLAGAGALPARRCGPPRMSRCCDDRMNPPRR